LTLLTIAPLTLTFPFALGTYLFVAHTLGAPNEALGAAVLAGGVTALVGMFCVGLVDDTCVQSIIYAMRWLIRVLSTAWIHCTYVTASTRIRVSRGGRRCLLLYVLVSLSVWGY
jgi:hypothetical protein